MLRSPSPLDILVVDDDRACLGSLADCLGVDGHRIRTATRGREAIEIARAFRRSGWGFHLSILDVNVPDMSGLETYDALVGLWPDLSAIFISGDADPALQRSVRRIGGLALLAKPLDLVSIRRTIAGFVLERTGGRKARSRPVGSEPPHRNSREDRQAENRQTEDGDRSRIGE